VAKSNEVVYINVSGVDDEPLWVDVDEIAAIGVRGANDTAIVLKSGTTIIAKDKHPNEVIGEVMASADPEG
jgi:uncharacterized protein YlzI (FlbEa/FlbD family)